MKRGRDSKGGRRCAVSRTRSAQTRTGTRDTGYNSVSISAGGAQIPSGPRSVAHQREVKCSGVFQCETPVRNSQRREQLSRLSSFFSSTNSSPLIGR